MKKNWLLVVGLVLVLAVAGLSGCGPSGATLSGDLPDLRVSLSSQQEGIWVSGRGEVSAIPDIAILRLGIEAQETSVAQAQTKAAEAMDRTMAALVDNGVNEKDIQTQYFNIRRVTRWDNVKQEEVVIGYQVTNMVTAKIREVDRVGVIIDAVAIAGGDLTRIDSVSFSVDDPSTYHDEARQEAIADAKAKAEQLAGLSGVKLGKPTYISESAQVPSPIYRQDMVEKAMGAPAVETPISPGEMEIRLTVQVAYAILD
ncbi:SIMPL domain-containing protein [Chloroflexota bacterium]